MRCFSAYNKGKSKVEFKIEFYINELQPKFYIPIARYRTANNRLPIERGSWNDAERSQRVYTLCNRNELRDEFHYLFECEFFLKKLDYIYRVFIVNMLIP